MSKRWHLSYRLLLMKRNSIIVDAIRSSKVAKRLGTRPGRFPLSKRVQRILEFFHNSGLIEYTVEQRRLKNNEVAREYQITDAQKVSKIRVFDNFRPILKSTNRKILRHLKPTIYDRVIVSCKRGLIWEQDLGESEGGRILAIVTK